MATAAAVPTAFERTRLCCWPNAAASAMQRLSASGVEGVRGEPLCAIMHTQSARLAQQGVQGTQQGVCLRTSTLGLPHRRRVEWKPNVGVSREVAREAALCTQLDVKPLTGQEPLFKLKMTLRLVAPGEMLGLGMAQPTKDLGRQAIVNCGPRRRACHIDQ